MLRSLTHARRRSVDPTQLYSLSARTVAATARPLASLVYGRASTDRQQDSATCLIGGYVAGGPRRGFSSTAHIRARVPFKLHDIGEGITEVEMLKWKVAAGDRVDHFDDLCEVQSDKSTAELTSPTPGIVVSIDVHEGDTVKVGQTLCVIENEEEGGAGGGEVSPVLEDSSPAIVSEVFEPEPSTSPEVRTAEAVTEAAERSAEVSPSGPDKRGSETSQTVAGFDQVRLDGIDSDGGASVSTGVQFTGEASILPSAPSTRGSDLATHPPLQERRERDVPSETRRVILASPAVRTLAGRLGIDLGAVQGSGEKGRVTREDVERYAGSTAAASGSSTSDTSLPAAGSSSIDSRRAAGTLGTRSQWTETTRVEFGRTRKVMYRALGAQAEVPHFGYTHTLDLTPLLPYIKANNADTGTQTKAGYLAADIPATLVGDPLANAAGGPKMTLLTFLVKAMLLAMEEHPIMRAKVVGSHEKERALEIRRDGVIGVAVSDPKYGLLTPSLPSLTPSTPLSALTSHLVALRANPTKPGGQSANVVISSVGGLGESTGAMPIIPPNGPLAICAVGRAKWEVEWVHRDAGMKSSREEVERAGTRAVLRCSVGWSGDHRVLEGAELIAFTESWKTYIEEPWRWIKVDG